MEIKDMPPPDSTGQGVVGLVGPAPVISQAPAEGSLPLSEPAEPNATGSLNPDLQQST